MSRLALTGGPHSCGVIFRDRLGDASTRGLLVVDTARLLGALPFPIILDASPCKPDHEFPQSPDNEFEEVVLLSLPGLLFREGCDRGISRTYVRDGWLLGIGDREREVGGEPLGEVRRVLAALLKGESPSSSRPDISLRCLGRRALAAAGVVLRWEEEDVWVMVGWFMPTAVEGCAAEW